MGGGVPQVTGIYIISWVVWLLQNTFQQIVCLFCWFVCLFVNLCILLLYPVYITEQQTAVRRRKCAGFLCLALRAHRHRNKPCHLYTLQHTHTHSHCVLLLNKWRTSYFLESLPRMFTRGCWHIMPAKDTGINRVICTRASITTHALCATSYTHTKTSDLNIAPRLRYIRENFSESLPRM